MYVLLRRRSGSDTLSYGMADKDTHPHHYPHPQHPRLLLPPAHRSAAPAPAPAAAAAASAPPPPPSRPQQQHQQRPRAAIQPNLRPPGRRPPGSGDGDHTLARTAWDVTKEGAGDDGSPKKKKLKLILKLRKPEEQGARDGSAAAGRGSVIPPLRSKPRPWVPKSDGLAAAGPTTSTSASESLDDDAPSPANKKRKLRDPALAEDLPRRRMKEAPPPAANGVSTPFGQELQQLQGPEKVFAELLEKFQKKDTYSVFAEPVDLEEIPDYHEIIKEPMDFSTIRKKLVKGAYTSLELFERDVLLICSNAMKYNAPRTIYYKQAKAIKDTARKAFEALKGRINGHKKGGGKQNSSLKKPKRSAAAKKNGDSSNEHAQNGLAPSDGKRTSTLDRVAELNQKSNPHFHQATFNDLEASEASLTRSISAKDARKLLAVDENRRNTYRPPGFFDDDFLTHLVPFGCQSSGAYAQSLAMFGANFNSLAWAFVARKIRKALAPNVPFGRGWVGEDQELSAAKGGAAQLEVRDDAMDTAEPMFQAIQTRLNRPATEPPSSAANLPSAPGFFPGLDALAKTQADNNVGAAGAAGAAGQAPVKHWLLPSTSGTSTSVQLRANVDSNPQQYASAEANHSQQLQVMEANIKQFREAKHRHADPGGQHYNTLQQRKVEERMRYAEANPQLVVPSTSMQVQRIGEFHGQQQQQQLRPFGSGDVSNVASAQQLKFLGPKFVGNPPNSSDADAGRGLWTMPRQEIQTSVGQEHQSAGESAASTSLALSSLSGPYGRVGIDSSSGLGQQSRNLFQSLKGQQQQQQQQRHQQQQHQATSMSSSSQQQQQQQQHRVISDLNCRSDVNSGDFFSREGGQQQQQQQQQLPLDLYSAISQSLLQPWKSSQRAPNSVRPLPPDLNVRLQSPKSPQHQHHHPQLQPQLHSQHHHQQLQATTQQMQRPQAQTQAQPDLALQL